jgi:hypothetical protein
MNVLLIAGADIPPYGVRITEDVQAQRDVTLKRMQEEKTRKYENEQRSVLYGL